MVCFLVKFSRTIAACLLGVFCATAQAAGWEVTPFLGVEGIYSDNISHSPESGKTDDVVSELSPGFKAILNSKRLQSDIFYRLQSLYYSQDHSSHESYQQLRAKLNMEILQESLFLDTNATIGQQVINPEKPVSFRSTALSGNRTDVRTASVNPYWQAQWDNEINALLSVRESKVDYAEKTAQPQSVPDSRVTSSKVNLSISDNPQSFFGGGLGASRDEIEYANDVRNQFGQSYIYNRIRISAKATLNLTLGKEHNEFQTMQATEPKGRFWDVSLRLTPALNHHLEIKTGERTFGTTQALDWRYAGRHWTTAMQYNEDFFTDSQRQLQAGTAVGLPSLDTDLSQASTGVYLRERAEARLAYDWSKTVITMSAFQEQRDFQAVTRQDILHGVQMDWEWRFKSSTYLQFEYKIRRDELNMGVLLNRVILRSLSFRRKLNSLLDIKIQLGQERLESSTVLNDYRENWLSLSVEREF